MRKFSGVAGGKNSNKLCKQLKFNKFKIVSDNLMMGLMKLFNFKIFKIGL